MPWPMPRERQNFFLKVQVRRAYILRDRRKRRSCDLIHELLLQEPEQSCMARIAIRTGCTHTASLAGARRKGPSLRGASKQWTEVYLNQAPTTRLGFQFSVSRTLRPYSLNFADLAAPPQTSIPQYSSTREVGCAGGTRCAHCYIITIRTAWFRSVKDY